MIIMQKLQSSNFSNRYETLMLRHLWGSTFRGNIFVWKC